MKKFSESSLKKIDSNTQDTTVMINSDIPEELSKISKDETQSFEDFKTLYKEVIDLKYNQDYGAFDEKVDKTLWEDCAKELYMSQANYILKGDEYKPKEELDKEVKTESKSLKEDSDIAHYKVSQLDKVDGDIDDEYAIKVSNKTKGTETNYLNVNKDIINVLKSYVERVEVDNDRIEEAKLGNNTFTDEDEASYYRNKELYNNSGLARHRDAMEKAKEACLLKGIKIDESKNLKEENAIEFIELVDKLKQLDLWDGKDETFKDAVKKYYEIQETDKKLHEESFENKIDKKDYSDDIIKKAVKDNMKRNKGIFTDDSVYDVVEEITGISDIDKMPEEVINKVKSFINAKNESKLQEDQYENERRRGVPAVKRIAEMEYYDNEDWYKNHIKDYKDITDFVNKEIAEIAFEYNLRDTKAEEVCKEIYKLMINTKNENCKVEENKSESECKFAVGDVIKDNKTEKVYKVTTVKPAHYYKIRNGKGTAFADEAYEIKNVKNNNDWCYIIKNEPESRFNDYEKVTESISKITYEDVLEELDADINSPMAQEEEETIRDIMNAYPKASASEIAEKYIEYCETGLY